MFVAGFRVILGLLSSHRHASWVLALSLVEAQTPVITCLGPNLLT